MPSYTFYDIFLLVIELKKNNFLLIGIIIVLLLIFSFIVFLTIKERNDKTKDLITYLSVNELKEKIKNKDDFVLVFTQEGCSHCNTYHEVLNSVLKDYEVELYDLNLTDVKDNEITELNKIASINGTPTTLFYIDGEEQTTLNRINGSTSKTNLVNKLKKMGYIKE